MTPTLALPLALTLAPTLTLTLTLTLALTLTLTLTRTLDEGDGRKLVCISMEKRLPDTPYSESLRAPADTAPLFESLRIGGREVGAPGLVKGRYVTLPSAPPKPASTEGSYGGFDGTCADMRGDTPPGLDPDKLPGTP